MYAIVVKCDNDCEHIVSVGKTYMDAWANIPNDLISLTTTNACRTVRVKRSYVEGIKKFNRVGGINQR